MWCAQACQRMAPTRLWVIDGGAMPGPRRWVLGRDRSTSNMQCVRVLSTRSWLWHLGS
jgi:hypothetical protein